VKKFYGILPRDTIKEIKTVRMVKRDSKERSVSKSGSNLDDDDDDDDDQVRFRRKWRLLQYVRQDSGLSVTNEVPQLARIKIDDFCVVTKHIYPQCNMLNTLCN
jgi:hypothetical protein